MLSKDYKIGKTFEEIDVGMTLQITENIEDKHLLLYLGLTNDNNPLYIQHEYAALTDFQKPVVPSIMLSGILTSAISKYLPGPGSYISSLVLRYPLPLHHYETLTMNLKVTKKDVKTHEVTIQADGKNKEGFVVLLGEVTVIPPLEVAELVE